MFVFFFFNDTATTEIYTLSLHDALPISRARGYSLDNDVKMFFALANAELDASIAAWNAKRQWDYVRPITAVHVRKKNQLVLAWAGPYKGTRLIWGQDWQPYQP